MGWNNPPMPWAELERKLSDHRPGGPPSGYDGGDSPAWSRKREAYAPPPRTRPQRPPGPVTPYAELHCHSNFSFLDGASHPEELVEEAIRLGLNGLALTDHDGFYGVVRMAEAAESYDLADGLRRRALARADPARRTVSPTPRAATCSCSPGARTGYHRLARAITAAQLARRREGPPGLRPRRACRRGEATTWLVLTGCRKGRGPTGARHRAGTRAAARELDHVDRGVRSRPGLRRAVRPRPPDRHRAQRRAGRARRPSRAPGRRHQQRALRHPVPAPARGCAGRGTRPAQPGRHGRLAAGVRCRPSALGGGDDGPVRPLPRCGRPDRPAGRRAGVPAQGGQADGCPGSRCPTATPR